MSTTFEEAQVGDAVWSVRFGHGTIDSIYNDPNRPLVIRFSEYAHPRSYTVQGQEFPNELQTLFWQEIKFEVPEKPPHMKLINGIEVPNVSFNPDVKEYYYYPVLEPNLYGSTFFLKGTETDEFRATNNLCYPYTPEGKEAAILHTKALLGVK
jgi:hypothetical protein